MNKFLIISAILAAFVAGGAAFGFAMAWAESREEGSRSRSKPSD